MRFDHRKACRRLVEVRSVRFDHRKGFFMALSTANRVGGLWKK